MRDPLKTNTPVHLDWLGGTIPASACGTSWGVPWPQGAIASGTAFTLADAQGSPIAVQSWPLAYWPDNTLKWSGHSMSASAGQRGPFHLSAGQPVPPETPLQVEVTDGMIEVRSGTVACRVPTTGQNLVETLSIGGRTIATGGRLVVLREDRSEYHDRRTLREEEFVSRISSAVVEHSGEVRVVVKIEGCHRALSGERDWLPFTVRLYFHAGVSSVRMVHSFVFDGDQEQDFIRGMGVRFSVPLREELHNRHVRLAGEFAGMFAEPVRMIAGRRIPSPEMYEAQIAGTRIPALDDLPLKENVAMMAAWDSYKLAQTSASAFTILKRTGTHSAWIIAAAGKRSMGMAFAGDTSGGMALGMKNFWQLAPTMLEITGAAADTAELTVWLWSPDAPAMDMRHYDIKEHGLEASYEDFEPGFSTATGIARTTELTFCPFESVPSNSELLALAQVIAEPPRPVCTPEYYHAVGAFGIWSLPDRGTPFKSWIEDQIDRAVTFYQGQIEQHHWYGFWDFGDVMHSYDTARHVWRYDMGGCAWANTELMPDLWLWYSFLRSGRADIFAMAEAMTRHTQEVDVYHTGRFQGLGTRHNVRHWGCGAKEARIGQSQLKRIFYFLTTDERTGDLMTEVTDTDFRTVEIDPLRKIEPKTQYPTHARVGPDWFAYCSNWLAAWERTGDTRFRDKILTGMHCMAAMPHKLFSGESYGYDPQTGMLFHLHAQVDVPHLAALMGGPELCMELTPLLDDAAWNDAWLHYCRYLQAPAEEQIAVMGAAYHNGRGPHFARMTGYAAHVMHDQSLAARAWREFLRTDKNGQLRPLCVSVPVTGPDVPTPRDESPRTSTNDAAQWSLNAIELLELVGDALPAEFPGGAE